MKKSLICCSILLFILFANSGFAQHQNTIPGWLRGEMKKRHNLYLLNETGYRNLISIMETYHVGGLLLGESPTPDSLFIFKIKKEGTLSSCITVQRKLLKMSHEFNDLEFSNTNLLDSANFRFRAPAIKRKTIIILFNRVAKNRFNAFYKDAETFGKDNDIDILYIVTDNYF